MFLIEDLNANYLDAVKRGVYVGKGYFISDLKRGKGCPKCDCKEVVKKEFFDTGHKFPYCANCGQLLPYRLKKVLPGIGKKDIRFNGNIRLTTEIDGVYCIKKIDSDLINGTFNPIDYLSKKQRDQLNFKAFAEMIIKERYDGLKNGKKTHSKAGIDKFRSVIRNHLIPYFGTFQLERISSRKIDEYKNKYSTSTSNMINALTYLKTLLNIAVKREYIGKLPAFDSIKRQKHKKGEEFISPAVQQRVIDAIKEPQKRAGARLLSLFGLRPCEVRALVVSDIDWHKKTITIQRHYSKTELKPGRKSSGPDAPYGTLKLPFLEVEGMPTMEEIFSDFEAPKDPEAHIFQTSRGRHFSEHTILKAWNKAAESLGLKGLPSLYVGTKHATASAYFRAGVPKDVIKELLGHTDIATTERYAKSNTDFIKESFENVKVLKKKEA